MTTATTSLSQKFLDALEKNGFNHFSGVPCSLLKGVIKIFDTDPRYGYVSAVREDSAVGMACGAYLGGAKPAVFMQNSGLGVSINALSSLSIMYETPLLLVISWRGYQGKDAPEHIQMGAVSQKLLETLGIPFTVLEAEKMEAQIAEMAKKMDSTRKPVALLVRPGILDEGGH
ncbi:MAG: sulfopyruvate decarboxylase subunit alpha [Planctomycetaceae bacterium]|nr:sulfopyruvate decarboxylase subunit alpha [Planctomycetaceae bacterium]